MARGTWRRASWRRSSMLLRTFIDAHDGRRRFGGVKSGANPLAGPTPFASNWGVTPFLARPLDYATTQALFARPHFAALGAITTVAIGRHRVYGRALLQARLGEDGRDIGGETTLQGLRGHERV